MRIVHVGLPDRTQSQYTEEQVQSLWRRGQLPTSALYWIDGMPDWRPLSELFVAPTPPTLQSTAYSVPAGIRQPFQPTNASPAPIRHSAANSAIMPPHAYRHPYPQSAGQSIYSARSGGGRQFAKDPGNLTRTLIVLLKVIAGFLVAEILVEIAEIVSLSSPEATYASSQALELILGLLALSRLVVFIITVVHFCKWMHRANCNVRGFGSDGLEFTPEWAAGCFFVPILCFYRPYQAMTEIWNASNSPSHWSSLPIAQPVQTWWALYITAWFVGVVAGRLSNTARAVSELQMSTSVYIVADVLLFAAALAAVHVIRRITEMQVDYVTYKS